MFFVIWGWQQRGSNLGVVGPYTCPTCSWVGTFWLTTFERRFRIYFIPVGRWNVQYRCVCRNCSYTTYVSPEEATRLRAEAKPIGAPDRFGPAPAARTKPLAPPNNIPEEPWKDAGDEAWGAFANQRKRR